ncbi:MerR family transcriptional regulator [Thermodesulfobium sp. 4217-1]
MGLIPHVGRNKSKIRNYTEENCNWIEFIKCMRNAGLSIEVLIDYARLFLQRDDTIEARKNLFIEQRKYLIEKMENTKKTLERLDYKISVYEKIVVEKEKSLRRDSLYIK